MCCQPTARRRDEMAGMTMRFAAIADVHGKIWSGRLPRIDKIVKFRDMARKYRRLPEQPASHLATSRSSGWHWE